MIAPDVIDEICQRLREGEPLSLICAEPGLPTLARLTRAMDGDPELADRVTVARDQGWDRIAYEMRMVARGEQPYSTADVVRDKLIIDTDLKLLSKWDRKRYGEAVDIAHSGEIRGAAVESAASAIDARIGALLGIAGDSKADADPDPAS